MEDSCEMRQDEREALSDSTKLETIVDTNRPH